MIKLISGVATALMLIFTPQMVKADITATAPLPGPVVCVSGLTEQQFFLKVSSWVDKWDFFSKEVSDRILSHMKIVALDNQNADRVVFAHLIPSGRDTVNNEFGYALFRNGCYLPKGSGYLDKPTFMLLMQALGYPDPVDPPGYLTDKAA